MYMELRVTMPVPEPTELDEWSAFAEPAPEWDKALSAFGSWWDFHVYFTAVCFLIIALLAAVCFVFYICSEQKRSHRIYFALLSSMVFVLGASRGVFMLIDPYNHSGFFHPAVAYSLRSVSLPCFTASFYLIFVAWLKATRMQQAHVIQQPLTMVLVLGAQFVVSLAFDLAAGFSLHASYLQLVCQACFVVLSTALSVLFFLLFKRIYHATVVNRRRLSRLSTHRAAPASTKDNSRKDSTVSTQTTEPEATPKKRSKSVNSIHVSLPTGAKVIFASAVLLLLLAVQNLIGMLTIYTRLALTRDRPAPWSWWAFEFSLRVTEIALTASILYTVIKPMIQRARTRSRSKSRDFTRSTNSA